jgi:hypothetical protein
MTTTMTINDRLVELGTLEKNEATSVQRVGARLVDEFLGSYPAPIHNDEIVANVLYYLTDIQVRDYALGLLGQYSDRRIELALTYLRDVAPTDTIYISAPSALLAVLYYEQGNTADAFLTLSNAQEDYSLRLLLDRVFKSNWDTGGFARMRAELHPQVTEKIFGKEK